MPPPSLSPERAKVAKFYSARSKTIPPLPWQTFALPFSAVYSQYKSWADLNGIKHPVTHKTLRDRLTLLGFGKQKTRDCNWVVGLKLNAVIFADSV